ncbi:hypothetical protein [Nostoc sp. 'Lobaria pulmonaria (5183) cyanobiont']|uniref:hypothetical protein n=1 Tax=Nostoc sp. 'Lobaria pulmonaria (5183) cyanobiont' TaxID=1618022 RepID=UPI000CF338DE|nr:hypothetical protein [Nostoc sp. 'Lobaria pulmonaria (5183) cyanobiont']AVH74413.1 hypothetical protein NLP_30018 [Nostoc sp. 'Lobaria pulmonaria (5183) cyanobiont']
MTEQHYRMTLSDAIAKYQGHDLTAKGLVHFYILIKCRPGWKIRLEHQKVCEELGIAKTAFYSAISRLRSEGSIDWEAPKGILVSISGSFRECGMDSTIAETESANAEWDSTITETESANAEWDSTNAETKSPEPMSSGSFSDSPDLLTDSYQFFSNSLSEGERENFIEFGKKKAAQLPKAPELPLKWIEKNFDELRSQWYKSTGKVSPVQSAKWETDPRTRDWLAIIEETGNPLEFASDKEKIEFVKWCKETKQFSWLREGNHD